MADKLLLEDGTSRVLLEDGASLLLLEALAQGGNPAPLPHLGLLLGSGSANYTLTALSGGYSVSGQSATLLRSKLITASAGSYTITGISAGINKGRILTASAGSYLITGQSAGLLRSKLITASAGSYAVSGQSATILRSKLITASAGSYSLTGVSAVITYTPAATGYTLTAQAGSYTISGQNSTLLRSKLILASAGTYAYTGQSAALLRSSLITAQAGSYSVTGQSATLTYTPNSGAYTLTALAGSYVVTGQSAIIIKSGETQASGGWPVYWGHFEREYRRRRDRLRKLEEQEEAENLIQEETDREIARILHEQERLDEERNYVARLNKLVLQYSPQEDETDRIKFVMLEAKRLQTRATMERLAREIAKQKEFEEIALFLLFNH